MKRNKNWKAFTGAANTNELGHVSGVMENDFHAIKAGSNVLVSALPNKNIITIEELNAPQGQFYWTSAIQGVSLSLMNGLVIQRSRDPDAEFRDPDPSQEFPGSHQLPQDTSGKDGRVQSARITLNLPNWGGFFVPSRA